MAAKGEVEDEDGEQIALRVSQLDATELDVELFELLKAQLNNVFKYFKPGWLTRYHPEVNATLRFVLWKYTVNAVESTIGQLLLELKYKNVSSREKGCRWMSHRQKLFYCLLTVGVPYITERASTFAAWTSKIKYSDVFWESLEKVEGLWQLFSLLNFLVFLVQGRYQYLVERILRIRAVFPQPQGVRQVGFEYMDRELLWHGFAEFLFFVMPLINFRRIKNFITKKIMPSMGPDDKSRNEEDLYECVVCQEWPCNPQEIGCRHVFCYYCVQANYAADPGYCCPACGFSIPSVDDIKPVIISDEDKESEEQESENG